MRRRRKVQSFEKTTVKVAPCDLVESSGEVKLVRRSDGKKTEFSRESLPYLQNLMAGHSVETIVLDFYRRNQPIDFVVFKKTLATLYWSNNILNSAEFREAFGPSDWLPVRHSRFLEPFFEIDVNRQNVVMQTLLCLVPLFLVFLALKTLSTKPVTPLALLLVPQAFLTVKGIFASVIGILFNEAPPILSLQLAPMGLFLKESSVYRNRTRRPEYFCQSLTTLALAVAGALFLANMESHVLARGGCALILLVTCLLLSPSHKTDLSNYFLDVEKKKTKAGFLIVFSSSIFSVFLSLVFLVAAAVICFKMAHTWHLNLAVPALTFSAIALVFIQDVADDLDFIIGQTAGQWRLTSTRSLLLNFFGKHRKVSARALLEKTPLFQMLDKKILEAVSQTSTIVQVQTGFRICQEGQCSTDLYVILKGRVGVYKKQEDGTRLKIMELTEGSVFGEGGFFLGRPRSGDVIAHSSTVLYCVKRPPDFETSRLVPEVMAGEFQKKMWAFQTLTQSPLFKEIPLDVIIQLVSRGDILELSSNSVLARQGDFSDCMWILIEGLCNVVINGAKCRELGVGDVIGEIGIIWNMRRTATVIAGSSCLALRVPANDLRRLLSMQLNLGVLLEEVGTHRLMSQAA